MTVCYIISPATYLFLEPVAFQQRVWAQGKEEINEPTTRYLFSDLVALI